MYLLQQAATARQAFDDACAAVTTQGPATTQATQGPATTDNDTASVACTAALNTLTTNIASCTPTPQNPTIICDGVCRGYYDEIFASCSAAVSFLS